VNKSKLVQESPKYKTPTVYPSDSLLCSVSKAIGMPLAVVCTNSEANHSTVRITLTKKAIKPALRFRTAALSAKHSKGRQLLMRVPSLTSIQVNTMKNMLRPWLDSGQCVVFETPVTRQFIGTLSRVPPSTPSTSFVWDQSLPWPIPRGRCIIVPVTDLGFAGTL
jgi:hypothetical protein